MRSELLDVIRRRAIYRRTVVGSQVLGIGGAWLGVLLPQGRQLTLVGVAVALISAVIALIDKDRMQRYHDDISRLVDLLRTMAVEEIQFRAEIGPYSFVYTHASGVTPMDLLRERTAPLDPRARDELITFLESSGGAAAPSAQGARLLTRLRELTRMDDRGREQERRTLVLVDVLRVLLLGMVLVSAATIPILNLPGVVLATLTTLISVSSRTVNDGSSTFGTQAGAGQRLSEIDKGPQYASKPEPAWMTETTLEATLTSVVSVPRSLLVNRTRRVITQAINR